MSSQPSQNAFNTSKCKGSIANENLIWKLAWNRFGYQAPRIQPQILGVGARSSTVCRKNAAIIISSCATLARNARSLARVHILELKNELVNPWLPWDHYQILLSAPPEPSQTDLFRVSCRDNIMFVVCVMHAALKLFTSCIRSYGGSMEK